MHIYMNRQEPSRQQGNRITSVTQSQKGKDKRGKTIGADLKQGNASVVSIDTRRNVDKRQDSPLPNKTGQGRGTLSPLSLEEPSPTEGSEPDNTVPPGPGT